MQGRIVRSVLEHLPTELNHARYINPNRPTLGHHWSGPHFLDPYVWRASRNQDKDEIFTNGYRRQDDESLCFFLLIASKHQKFNNPNSVLLKHNRECL